MCVYKGITDGCEIVLVLRVCLETESCQQAFPIRLNEVVVLHKLVTTIHIIDRKGVFSLGKPIAAESEIGGIVLQVAHYRWENIDLLHEGRVHPDKVAVWLMKDHRDGKETGGGDVLLMVVGRQGMIGSEHK